MYKRDTIALKTGGRRRRRNAATPMSAFRLFRCFNFSAYPERPQGLSECSACSLMTMYLLRSIDQEGLNFSIVDKRIARFFEDTHCSPRDNSYDQLENSSELPTIPLLFHICYDIYIISRKRERINRLLLEQFSLFSCRK